jgi:DNA-binding MarR family transcriptional regulator
VEIRAVKDAYLQIIALIERLHREFLEVVKAELDRRAVRDLNNVQAMILFNIGEEELSVGELTIRGCYLGSNVSYNLKKLTENGYIEQTRSQHDRRSVTVRLSEKGRGLAAALSELYSRHVASLEERVGQAELAQANNILMRLEQFWSSSLGYGWRVAGPMASDAA